MLGLSLTSSSVGWVLLDGQGPDAATLDDDAFDIQPGTAGHPGETSPHAAAARGAHAIAMASGHQVGPVHVAWTDDVEEEAAALLKSLADLGCDDVHAIPLTRAARAWGIEAGVASEHSKTALCVLETGGATIMVVATGAGTVRTAIADTRETTEDLVEWLRTVFRKDGWLPESLYLVGARAELDDVTEPIADALPIPVSSSVDAQLALARGAALASADAVHAVEGPRERVSVPKKSTAPLAEAPTVRVAEATAAAADAETAVVPVVDHGVASPTETPQVDPPRHERPWLVTHAKKVTISAAAVAVVGAALSLTAGSALNVENASVQAAEESDSGASATTASVHSVPAPPPVRPAPELQPLAAVPQSQPGPVAPPAETATVAAPEPVAAPVPHLTVAAPSPVADPVAAPAAPPPIAAPVVAPAPIAAPGPVAEPVAAPPAAPLAAPDPIAAPAAIAPPVAIAPPPLGPAAAPAPAAPVAVAPLPLGPAPVPPPGAPVGAPPAGADAPPPDPIQAALSPLFGGLP